MSRRFNFTGRKKLMRTCIRIRMHEATANQVQSFTADVSISSDLQLTPQARVYVEAYVGTSTMRFDFGTVAAISHPPDCLLNDIDAGTPVLFRVKVVDETEYVGRLLASAHGIRPEGDDDGSNRKALLPLRVCDLGEVVWRLIVEPDAGPMLAVNSRIPGIKERLPTDTVLTAAIYPEVVRQMVGLVWGPDSSIEEDEDWLADWKTWLSEQLGREVTSDEIFDHDTLEALGDEVAQNFASKHKFASAMARLTGEMQ